MANNNKIKLFFAIYAVIIVVCLLYLDEVNILDKQLSNIITSYSNPILNNFFISVTFMGSIIFWSLMIALFWTGKNRKIATYLAAGLCVETLLTGSLKYGIDRARPAFGLINELTPSFPSSHSARAFLGATIIKHHRLLFVSIAVLVAFSRVYIGVHYPLDVIFGMMNGIMIGILINKIPEKKVERFLAKIAKLLK